MNKIVLAIHPIIIAWLIAIISFFKGFDKSGLSEMEISFIIILIMSGILTFYYGTKMCIKYIKGAEK